MTLVEAAPSDDMRVILCLQFDDRAPAGEVAAFKRALIECDYVLHSVEVSGSFDFMFEAGVRDFAAYQQFLERFGEPLARLTERHEANFICRRFLRVADRDKAIWVPCRDGRRRIDCATITVVRAEGDYVRIHCDGSSWLLHDTMHHMREKLDPTEFVTLHRSTIAHVGFIRRLVHRHRYWIAVLADGSEQRIAKSHVAEVLAHLRTDSAMVGDDRRSEVLRSAADEDQAKADRAAKTVTATPPATAIP